MGRLDSLYMRELGFRPGEGVIMEACRERLKRESLLYSSCCSSGACVYKTLEGGEHFRGYHHVDWGG